MSEHGELLCKASCLMTPLVTYNMEPTMKLLVKGMPSAHANHFRNGGKDANEQDPLHVKAQGKSNPCRHCLQLIAEGDDMLILGYRPFETVQAYAETGPIFLHKNECTHYQESQLPDWIQQSHLTLIRGYNQRDWILYETGNIVAGTELTHACQSIFNNPEVSYVHIRSRFNCFQCRVERQNR